MTELAIRGLSKRFGDVAAVDGFELRIGDHELVSLLGPSGCGKTTTLRCIAGFEEPTAGRILFDGRDVVGLPPERRNIGMVFQNYALFPHMTVRQNLAFGLEMRGVPKGETAERIARVLETVQLGDLGERYPRQLSGGQQQRIALARAMVVEPSILLLDEPLANLDAKLREEMRFFVRSLQKRVGITTVYVTHDQAEAMVISDRIVVMFDGRIHQVGAPDEIYSRPVSREVASFIGLSNFVEGRVRGAGGDGEIRLDTAAGLLRCAYPETLAAGREATLVVRPEAVSLSAAAPAAPAAPAGAGGNAVPGRVSERYFLGNITGYRVACAGGLVLQVQDDPWAAFDVGDEVRCAFDPAHTWIIPDRAGRRAAADPADRGEGK